MTNREWLENLSDSQLSAWLCDDLYNPADDRTYGISQIKYSYSHSELGLVEWLKGKRRESE